MSALYCPKSAVRLIRTRKSAVESRASVRRRDQERVIPTEPTLQCALSCSGEYQHVIHQTLALNGEAVITSRNDSELKCQMTLSK